MLTNVNNYDVLTNVNIWYMLTIVNITLPREEFCHPRHHRRARPGRTSGRRPEPERARKTHRRQPVLGRTVRERQTRRRTRPRPQSTRRTRPRPPRRASRGSSHPRTGIEAPVNSAAESRAASRPRRNHRCVHQHGQVAIHKRLACSRPAQRAITSRMTESRDRLTSANWPVTSRSRRVRPAMSIVRRTMS